MERISRRRVLGLLGAAAGGVALGAGPAAAESDGDRTRFIVDVDEHGRSVVPDDATVVHDLPEIGVVVAAGDPEAVPGSVTVAPDLTLQRHGLFGGRVAADADDDEDDEDGGPVVEEDEDDAPDDPAEPTRRDLQWDDHARGLSEEVHDEVTGDGARIGIVDDGVFDDHPDLAAAVNPELSRNFTGDGGDFRPPGPDNDHGTHVAGIAAATGDADPEGDTGVVGVAPDAEVVSLRVFGASGGAAVGDILAAVVHAANVGCDAVNLSLGFPEPFVFPERFPFLRDFRAFFEDAFAFARGRGTVVVTSAGNDALDMSRDDVLVLPTEADGALSVSATGPIGYLWDDEPTDEIEPEDALEATRAPTTDPAFYTNFGTVDLSAGGGDFDFDADPALPAQYDLVLSTVNPEAGWGWKAGTSMSAPQVAGAVALARAVAPEADAATVERLLRETATDLGETFHGDGHVDFESLIDAAEDVADEDGEDADDPDDADDEDDDD